MSSNERSSPKCLSTNESNIPISKRFHVDSAKKPKKRNDLPDLQRYIETIVKAQNDYNRENRENDKSHKNTKKVLDVLEKPETIHEPESNKQNEFRPGGNIKARRHDVADKEIKICEEGIKGMDHPYEYDINPILEIEKFLRKLYPNPYDLDKVSEFQVLKASQNFLEINRRSKSLNAPSIDVIPSSVDVSHSSETLVSQISTENDSFLKADIFIDQNMFVQNFDDILVYSPDDYFVSNTSESIISSEVIKAQTDKDNISDGTKMSSLLKNKIESRISSPIDRVRSRPSSAESEIRHFSPDSSVGISKKRNSSRRTNSERPSKAMPSKNKSDALVVLGKQNSDNLGTLNLVNSYDSNEIIQGDTIDERSRYEEEMPEQSKKVKNVKSASRKYFRNPTELHQLYHVMDKTAESILHITSRNEKDQTQNDASQDTDHSKSLEVSRRSSIISTKDLEAVSSSDRLQRTRKRIEREHSSPRQIERSLKNKSTIIAAFQKEKSKCGKERNIRTKEEEGDDDNSKPETRKDETNTDDNDFGELSGTNHRIDDVLQYMCDCLRKFTNDHKDQTRRNNDVTVLENVENKKPKSTGSNDSKHTKHISHEERNPTNLGSRDTTTPTTNEQKDSAEGFYPLEIVRNKSLSPGVSLETNDIRLNPGKHRRRKRLPTPQNLTKSCSSDEKTLELSPISVTTSSERLLMSSPPSRRPEIPDITPNSESTQQIVEPQNELGGYNEERPRETEVTRESQPKTLYPVRHRKQKRDSYRILKSALDTEEKLLADNLVFDEKSSNNFENSFKPSRSSVTIKGGPSASKPSPFTVMEEIKQQRSSFVICVSSIPRHLRTGYPTKIPYATSLSISLSNLRKSWDLKKVRKDAKTRKLKKMNLEPWVKHMGHHYTYRFEIDLLLILGRKYITHAAIVVGSAHVYGTSVCEDDITSKNSECHLKVKSSPPKKSLFVENLNVPVPSTSGTSSTNRKPVQITSSMMLSVQGERIEEENVGIGEAASVRTLEESEENTLTLEQNDESEQVLTCSGTSITYVIQNESSDSQTGTEAERERKKIQDLLLRTYHLQHKLHRYLHKISFPKTSSYCPLKERDTSTDQDATCKSDESELFGLISPMDIQTSSPSTDMKDSQVYWLLEPNVTKETQTKEHEDLREVEKVDHATSYHPPSNDSSRSLMDNKADSHGLREETSKKEERPLSPKLGNDDDDDDRSSTYSFKSSNDFSESNEVVNVEEKPKLQKTTNRNSQFLQKIFHELELFRKTITATKDKTTEDKLETKRSKDDSVALDKPKGNHVTDGKPSGKALKTVFKGKESTTELTIGLKDVPITDGSNISVEKKKFSQNHTKISISISKEKPEELCDVPRRYFKFASDNIHTTLSSYYFDSLRPTLSDCETKYSRLENDTSKSLNEFDAKEDEEDEDDDYKSVASSISSNSDTDKPDESDEKTITNRTRTLPTKTFTKHRFDFYRKMTLDTDYDMDRTKKIVLDSVSKYKELEPLKEALTEMQMRMRKLKKNSYFSSSEYYQRALKLAKMSAGFCQSCGSRSVIPENSSYKNLHPRRYPNQCRKHCLNSGVSTTPNSNFYSFRSSSGDLRTRFCDLDMCQSSYILKDPAHSAGPILGDVPIFMTKM